MHHTTSSSPPHETGLESYTYTSHIPRVGNTQRLIDSRNNVRVDTSFVNLNDGKDWGARSEMNGKEGSKTSGVWYIAVEGEGGLRLVDQKNEEQVRPRLLTPCALQTAERLIPSSPMTRDSPLRSSSSGTRPTWDPSGSSSPNVSPRRPRPPRCSLFLLTDLTVDFLVPRR